MPLSQAQTKVRKISGVIAITSQTRTSNYCVQRSVTAQPGIGIAEQPSLTAR
ncbi:Uncharacterised protein [Bifidobacterium longum]|uniref:Uncharacterized protein n=1 Tax=Bifidobacterium longum TaxID=216816 RepID=A0A6N2RAP5_BIFLN